ncbi:MAG: hypothetical protein IKH95_01405 [Bacteroidaceae bacterium]|nr:hypothetical protein [Bacteroidaceae bacterium]
MNRIFYNFIIVASLFTLAACSGKVEKAAAIKNDSISGTLLSDSLIFSLNCNHIFTMGNKLFLSNADPVEECAYRVVDLETKRFIDKFGFFGGGPGEFLNQKYAGKTMDNDTIYTYDLARRKIQVLSRKGKTTTYQYSHTLPVKTNDNSIFTILRRLENGYYVGVPYSGKSPFFILLDSTGQEAGRFGKIPVIGEYNEVMDLKRLEGELETSGNSVYYVTNHFGYLARYDVNDKGEAKLVWEQYLSEPQYRMEDGRIKLNRDKNLEGFYGITTVGDYVLATYSGKLFSSPFAEDPDADLPQTLIIFRKKDGKILKRLHLDRRVTLLTATEDGKTLIMNTYNPEVTYCLYDLEKILK